MKIPQKISHNTNCLLINWSVASAYSFSASYSALGHCCLDLLKDTFCQQQLFIDNCFGLFVGLTCYMAECLKRLSRSKSCNHFNYSTIISTVINIVMGYVIMNKSEYYFINTFSKSVQLTQSL